MSSALFLSLTLLASPQVSKKVDFIGFSGNEQAAAFKVSIERRSDVGRYRDRYSLVRLVETKSSTVVATFKNSGITRRFTDKRRRHVKATVLQRDNPDWAQARSQREWKKLRRSGRFRAKAMIANDSALRLSRDNDAPGEMKAEAKYIEFRGEPNAALGYQPIARLMEGTLTSLGHFRREASMGRTWSSRVRVLHSRTGLCAAVLVSFDPGDGGATEWEGHVVPLPESIGTTGVGAMNLSFSALRVAEDRYKSLHPEYGKEYDQYVGRHWK